jgi:hypothetical protein
MSNRFLVSSGIVLVLVIIAVIIFMNTCCGPTHAAIKNYYVSPAAVMPTTAPSSATPWKTLDKVNASMGLFRQRRFHPLQARETFTGRITVTKGGAAGLPIVFGAYGTVPPNR